VSGTRAQMSGRRRWAGRASRGDFLSAHRHRCRAALQCVALAGGGSVAVQLDRVAVRVLDVDGTALAAAMDRDAGLSDARANLLPLSAREVQAEMVEATGRRIEPAAGLDEVQQVVATRRLQEDHPLVGKRAYEAQDVDVEALGLLEIARLGGRVARAAVLVRFTRRHRRL